MALRGWYEEIDGRAAVFFTDDKPIEPGKKLAFRVTAISAVTSFGWVVFDSDGNPIAEGRTNVKSLR